MPEKRKQLQEKELSEEDLGKVSAGCGEIQSFSEEDKANHHCPKGVTAETFPHIRAGEMGAHCFGYWYVGKEIRDHRCDYLSYDRRTGKNICKLCNYVEK